MANFRESIDGLKEAGLADSEILEIMSESVDGQMLTKHLQKIKESDHELPDRINTETFSTRKRKPCVLSAEKHTKSIRQDSPRHNLEREDARLNFSPNRTASPLSVSPNRFSFSADMDEASDLTEKTLNGEFPELPPKKTQLHPTTPKSLLKAPK